MDVKIVVQPRGGFVLDALDDDRLGQSDVAALAPPNESVDHFPFPLFLFCVYNIYNIYNIYRVMVGMSIQARKESEWSRVMRV